MKQLTEEEAKIFYEDGAWKGWADLQIAMFQLWQERLCIPFSRFHRAVEAVLKRPVFTHEFASPEILREEVLETFFGLVPQGGDAVEEVTK